MTSSRVIIYLDNVIFYKLQRRLSDWNYADGDHDTWFSAKCQCIAAKMFCLRGSPPDTVVGLRASPTPQLGNVGSHPCRGPQRIAGPRAPRPHDPPLSLFPVKDIHRSICCHNIEISVQQLQLDMKLFFIEYRIQCPYPHHNAVLH